MPRTRDGVSGVAGGPWLSKTEWARGVDKLLKRWKGTIQKRFAGNSWRIR